MDILAQPHDPDPPDPRHPVLRMPAMQKTLKDLGAQVEVARGAALRRIRSEDLARQQAILDQHELEILEAEQTIGRLLLTVGFPRLYAILERKAAEYDL